MKTRRDRSARQGFPHSCLAHWLVCLLASPAFSQDFVGWRTYGGDDGNTHYSALDQINRANVSQLALAWRYDSARGAGLPATSELQVNPIIVDGVLYGRSPLYSVFALDAGVLAAAAAAGDLQSDPGAPGDD